METGAGMEADDSIVSVSQSKSGVARARHAKKLLLAGQWAEAVALYKELIAEFPRDQDLRRHVLLNAFKFQDYREVVEQTLDLADLYLAEGDSNAGLERYSEILRLAELVAGESGPEAAAEVEELVEPLKADIYFVFGDHYLTLGQADHALQYFEVSERLQEGRWETHWGRGQALLLKGDKRSAVKCLYQSIEAAPEDAASAYELLGEVLMGEGRPLSEVREYFVNASTIFSNYECYDDALRVIFRWLQLDSQDREMADRAKELSKMVHS